MPPLGAERTEGAATVIDAAAEKAAGGTADAAEDGNLLLVSVLLRLFQTGLEVAFHHLEGKVMGHAGNDGRLPYDQAKGGGGHSSSVEGGDEKDEGASFPEEVVSSFRLEPCLEEGRNEIASYLLWGSPFLDAYSLGALVAAFLVGRASFHWEILQEEAHAFVEGTLAFSASHSSSCFAQAHLLGIHASFDYMVAMEEDTYFPFSYRLVGCCFVQTCLFKKKKIGATHF